MNLFDSIYAHLATITALTDIVGDNIFHEGTEQQNPLRSVYFSDVGDDRLRGFGVSPALSSTRISFECWAGEDQDAALVSGQVAAEAIAAQIYAAFQDPDGDGSRVFTGELGGTGGVYVQDVRFESSRGVHDAEAKQFGRELDFTFDYRL